MYIDLLCCTVCSSCAGCRAREKINKPLLRNRRRGNDMDSLQKLQTIRQNQLDAIKVVHFLIKRERKKRDIAVRCQMHPPRGKVACCIVHLELCETSMSFLQSTLQVLMCQCTCPHCVHSDQTCQSMVYCYPFVVLGLIAARFLGQLCSESPLCKHPGARDGTTSDCRKTPLHTPGSELPQCPF